MEREGGPECLKVCIAEDVVEFGQSIVNASFLRVVFRW